MGKKITLVDVFLEKYKSLELMLRVSRGDAASVLQYENELTGDSADKMRVCRIMRNFLQHNPNAMGFVEPTQSMVAFLEAETERVTAATEKAKDKLYRLTPIKTSSTLREACKAFTKAKWGCSWLPVVNDKGVLVGLLTKQRLIQALSVMGDIDKVDLAGAIRNAEWVKTIDIPLVNATDDLAEYAKNKQDVIVLRGGKYSGVIRW